MKLINKFTLWYFALTTVMLLAGGIITFFAVQSEIEREATIRLTAWMENTVKQIKEGVQAEKLSGNNVEIRQLAPNDPSIPLSITDTMALFPPRSEGIDRKFTLTSSFKINGKHYYIAASDFVAEPDEIAEGIGKSLGILFLVLLLLTGIGSRIVSDRILSPFQKTLQVIQSFNLRQKENILLEDTRTEEFTILNQFLQKMTGKALDDYRSLKEFSENASHEFQTPLAIIRGKLELLMETNINHDQARLILSAQNAVQKLSAINQSLTLLTKLENQEYDGRQQVNFSELINESIATFDELIEMKSIQLEKKIVNNVYVSMSPVLANILFTNLMSNAIRHNLENGIIRIRLDTQKLVMENSGNALEVPADLLFQRFKKGNQSSDSIGLGLAIVKQISDLHHFKLQYRFDKNIHTIEIVFQDVP
jgi:signal transduction histidine kinase